MKRTTTHLAVPMAVFLAGSLLGVPSGMNTERQAIAQSAEEPDAHDHEPAESATDEDHDDHGDEEGHADHGGETEHGRRP